jgi:LuxR family transcriptional regulator, maltose regulon positive regulatory protein
VARGDQRPGCPGRPGGWVSLDERDNDPATFWTYVITALQAATPGAVGATALELLGSPQPPTEAALATLLNDLDVVPHDIVLVLDDYHVIDARGVHDGMVHLLEHVPPHVHLVLATRTDPPLPLPRLRARGELVEVRSADLRFTRDEAAAYLTGPMGLSLTAADVATLADRTEGWAAALQLAGLSLQDRDDPSQVVARFAGDDRFIVDYLADEVRSGARGWRSPPPPRASAPPSRCTRRPGGSAGQQRSATSPPASWRRPSSSSASSAC